ncbi:MAG: flagellar motor switch protein FliN [Deltaproteobacteria bacterium]|nr:flagellar motor switch protein FliN [Deltaproteobacteria bacterium]
MAEQSMDDAWANALEEAKPKKPAGNAAGGDWDALASGNDASGSRPPGFEELTDSTAAHSSSHNLDFLLDIPLDVSVELGRTSMIIDRMLQLTQGSVVELEKAAGEPVEIYVNRKLLGKGEVIVVNDRFGVRITEIISQADRIKNIG